MCVHKCLKDLCRLDEPHVYLVCTTTVRGGTSMPAAVKLKLRNFSRPLLLQWT